MLSPLETNSVSSSHPSEIAFFWTPPPLGITIALRGEGGGVCGIFSGTTHFLLFTLQGNETANGGANNHLCADNIQIPTGSSKTYVCSPKAYGRYLYIRIPGSNKTLTLCEVEVYSLSKSVNLSSCLFCRYAWCLCVYLLYLFFLPFTKQEIC